jgi:hypothetical protein
MNQSEFTKIFAAISEDLVRGPNDEYFLDGRAGFASTLAWAKAAIRLIEPCVNHELALQCVEKCAVILDSVSDHGWTVVTKRAAKEHATVMQNQQWN